jgi:hypothetical protein
VLDTELIAEGAAIRCGWRGLTDKLAADREAALVASGNIRRSAAHPDLFDPANTPPARAPSAAGAGERRSPAEIRAAEQHAAANPAATNTRPNGVRAGASTGARRVIRSGYMGN